MIEIYYFIFIAVITAVIGYLLSQIIHIKMNYLIIILLTILLEVAVFMLTRYLSSHMSYVH